MINNRSCIIVLKVVFNFYILLRKRAIKPLKVTKICDFSIRGWKNCDHFLYSGLKISLFADPKLTIHVHRFLLFRAARQYNYKAHREIIDKSCWGIFKIRKISLYHPPRCSHNPGNKLLNMKARPKASSIKPTYNTRT